MNTTKQKWTENQIQSYNDIFSGKTKWDLVIRFSERKGLMEMRNYHSVNKHNEPITSKYGVVVDNVDLQIEHRQILKSGFDYLNSVDRFVNMDEFLLQYDTFFTGYYPSVKNKQDIQKSSEKLSPLVMKQYKEEFVNHLTEICFPGTTDTPDTNVEELFSHISGSLES